MRKKEKMRKKKKKQTKFQKISIKIHEFIKETHAHRHTRTQDVKKISK